MSLLGVLSIYDIFSHYLDFHVYVQYLYMNSLSVIVNMMHHVHALIGQASFFFIVETCTCHFHFVLEYRDMKDVMKTQKNVDCFKKEIENTVVAFKSLHCDRNVHDAGIILYVSISAGTLRLFSAC